MDVDEFVHDADPELMKKVGELRKEFAVKAQKIVHTVMPSKVLAMEELLQTDKLFTQSVDDLVKPEIPAMKQLAASRKRAASGEPAGGPPGKKARVGEEIVSIPCNPAVQAMLRKLKKELLELIENLNTVKIWIQLNIPRIEDGNNFGVGVQEETVSELGRAEDNAFSMLESITKYYVARAKLVSKVTKYPEIVDYQQSIQELDEKEAINMRLCAIDLRNNYAILHDIVIKNLEKLKTPRTSSHMASLF